MHGARPAVTEDLDELQRLIELSVAATPERRGGIYFGLPARSQDPRQRLLNALAEPSSLVLAGTIDSTVVGVALVTSEGDVATIEELHVELEARHVGVGEALIEATVDWARANELRAIDYPALPGDRATKNLGERSGFSARIIVMHRRI